MNIPRLLLLAGFTCAAIAQSDADRAWMDRMRAAHQLKVPDWRPKLNTVTPVTNVEHAQFAATDIHVHLQHPTDAAAVRRVLAVMDRANLRRIVHVTAGFGPKLAENIRALESIAPGRFVSCANPDWSRINSPDFTSSTVRMLEQAHRDGARCLKITKVLGLYLKDSNGHFIAVNDPRMDPIWEKAGELGMPVLIHTADPIAFFQPWDEHNEAYAALYQHPDWWFYGKDAAGAQRFTHEELMRQRDDIVARHPRTHFLLLHYASLSHDLAAVGRLLDRFPNIDVETGGRNWALGTVPNSGRKFAIRYQDRILFGTDGTGEDPTLYQQHFRTLETEDDQIFNALPRSWGPIHGVHLPPEVLRKIYSQNAERLLHF